jgi:hypothetical protein
MATHLISNAPPDAATLFAEEVADLMLEAQNYLDGEPIANEAQAEAVSAILNRARRIAKDADETRKVEKKPHDDAAKAVQAKWLPIIEKAGLAATTAKQALAPWLQAAEAENERQAELARQEAERLAEIASSARATVGNILEAMDAENLLKIAEAARKDAAKLDKAKAHAKGGERAVGLRSVWTPTLTDPCAALKFYREREPELLKSWLVEQAEKDVRAGARSIPGFQIDEARVAV